MAPPLILPKTLTHSAANQRNRCPTISAAIVLLIRKFLFIPSFIGNWDFLGKTEIRFKAIISY
jgi:hypothetical protein